MKDGRSKLPMWRLRHPVHQNVTASFPGYTFYDAREKAARVWDVSDKLAIVLASERENGEGKV